MPGPLRRTIAVRGPLDLGRTVGPAGRGRGDPCLVLTVRELWRATRTPDGPATLHVRQHGSRLDAEAWGPGAAWALEHAPELVGATDVDRRFRAHHAVVAELQRRLPGVRLLRTGAVCEALVPTIIEQKVTGLEARRSYRRLVHALGEPAPGPGPVGLLVPPAPDAVAATPAWRFHRWEIERKRADTIRHVCARAGRVDEVAALPLADAYHRLLSFPGVGPWTTAEVATVALGDPDAVSVGDYHLPSVVSFALTGERDATDERMLELLEPYRGHRARVVRLLTIGGPKRARRAPRYAPRTIATI